MTRAEMTARLADLERRTTEVPQYFTLCREWRQFVHDLSEMKCAKRQKPLQTQAGELP